MKKVMAVAVAVIRGATPRGLSADPLAKPIASIEGSTLEPSIRKERYVSGVRLESLTAMQRWNYLSSKALTLAGFGKFFGIGSVTLPVAAHSVPRTSVVTKPTQCMPVRSCPIGVWKTRPLP